MTDRVGFLISLSYFQGGGRDIISRKGLRLFLRPDRSSSKYALIDGDGFSLWCHTFKTSSLLSGRFTHKMSVETGVQRAVAAAYHRLRGSGSTVVTMTTICNLYFVLNEIV